MRQQLFELFAGKFAETVADFKLLHKQTKLFASSVAQIFTIAQLFRQPNHKTPGHFTENIGGVELQQKQIKTIAASFAR